MNVCMRAHLHITYTYIAFSFRLSEVANVSNFRSEEEQQL